MSDEKNGLDIFGVKPIAETIHTVTKASVNGASAFLSRICLPAAEEFGLFLKDKVSSWRAKNAVSVVQKAEEKFIQNKIPSDAHAHPRLVAATIEHGSWSESSTVQDLWAGLLASSCSTDGRDESNVIFINILSQINSTEAVLFNHLCEIVGKVVSPGGWISPKSPLKLSVEELATLTGIIDMHRMDLELDHLRALNLIDGGFDPEHPIADVIPTPFGLQMYVKCQGYSGSPVNYFGLKPQPQSLPQRAFRTLRKALIKE